MPIQGRKFSSNSYKYGFNGQLKDDEIYGSGNLNSAEFWEYDTRLGRRWNMDPIVKPWESPYACFSDNPIYYNDVHGDDAKPKITPGYHKGEDGTVIYGDDNQGVTADKASKKEGKGSNNFKIKIKNVINTLIKSLVWSWEFEWNAFVKVDEYCGSHIGLSDFTPAVKTFLSGLEPKSNNPNKGVSMSSSAEGIETTTPYNSGTILYGVGFGFPKPEPSFLKAFREDLEASKTGNDAFNAGSDAVEGAKAILGISDNYKVYDSVNKNTNNAMGIIQFYSKDGKTQLEMKVKNSNSDHVHDSLQREGHKVTKY